MHARQSESRELAITRIYDAPLQAVWDAWTDPQQVAKWWGPRGFTLTTHSRDLRPGGTWDYTMHGPDGTDYPNLTWYHEVEPLRKLVYDHGGSAERPPLFRVTVRFSALDDGTKTRMEMTMTLPTPEAARQTWTFIRQAGGNATWDRLAEYLERQRSGSERFVIVRSFDAPLEVVHRMWTTPDLLPRWLPPTGFAMRILGGEIRAGARVFLVMTGGDGTTMHARFAYEDITPERIVYTQQFCDEREQPARHPLAPSFPTTLRTTVSFAEEGPEATRVTVTMDPLGDPTPAELATFVAGRSGMTQGWNGSFDQLEERLAAPPAGSLTVVSA
jgi:uncharacterized protein YndB with AHSA1/START domain